MRDIIAQIKGFFKLEYWRGLINKFFLSLAIILVAITSFSLGRVSKFMESSGGFVYEAKDSQDLDYEKEKDEFFGKVSTSTIVASSGGKKYYFVWCKGAQNIKQNKKIYFDTENLAQKAGYTLANNCK